jgi:UDP-N-acetylglucosamine 3-dehydrogenase
VIAVVGLGRWGHHHVETLRELAGAGELVGVDPDPAARAPLEEAGVATVSDLAELDRPLRAAVVATTPETRAATAAELLERGTPVFVEKPLATAPDDAWRLVELARERGLVLAVGHLFLFQRAHEHLHEQVRRLGRIRFLSIERWLPAADSDEAWSEVAPHELAVALDLGVLGDEVTEAELGRWYGGEDAPGGILGRVHTEATEVEIRCGVSSGARWREVWVVGEHGHAVQVDDGRERRVGLALADGGLSLETVDGPPPLELALRSFLDAVERKTPPRSDGVLGARVVELLTRVAEGGRVGARG